MVRIQVLSGLGSKRTSNQVFRRDRSGDDAGDRKVKPARETGSRHYAMAEMRLTEELLGRSTFGPSRKDLLNCHDHVIEQDPHQRQGDENGEHQGIIGADLATVE